MPVDFRQVQKQIKELGSEAALLEQDLKNRRQYAIQLIQEWNSKLSQLRKKVLRAAEKDPNLRSAIPMENSNQPLDGHFPTPQPPQEGTLLAADGSQINPDRHVEVNYSLINVGAIQMEVGSIQAPKTKVETELIHGSQLYQDGHTISNNTLALLRDLGERRMLSEIAEKILSPLPVISITDGPLELWGSKDIDVRTAFQQKLSEYHKVLQNLNKLSVITAGYVDKPGANLVVRLLEIAKAPEDLQIDFGNYFPLQGVTDLWLFSRILAPGERSTVFALQSGTAQQYRGPLAIHFYYLNVSSNSGQPKIARVEIPAWVANDSTMVDNLHAVLVQQCQILGTRSYPYLLHRAHEVAVVRMEEKEQITQMILRELSQLGLSFGEKSQKQTVKELPGKKRYSG